MTNSIRAGWPSVLWAALLVTTGLVFTLCFACITPLAGIAVIAAFTLPRPLALAASAAVWLANQAVGFGLLDYPQTANAYAWGAALGLATLASLGVAMLSARFVPGRLRAGLLALLAAFAVFEGTLFLASVAALGGMDGYGIETIARVGAINIAAAALLLAVHALGLPRLGMIETAKAH